MNENIEKLALRASTYADNHCMKVKKLNDGESWISIRDKKFAELIVKECLDIVKENKQSLPKNTCEWRDWEYGHWDASVSIEYDIKNKFGVE